MQKTRESWSVRPRSAPRYRRIHHFRIGAASGRFPSSSFISCEVNICIDRRRCVSREAQRVRGRAQFHCSFFIKSTPEQSAVRIANWNSARCLSDQALAVYSMWFFCCALTCYLVVWRSGSSSDVCLSGSGTSRILGTFMCRKSFRNSPPGEGRPQQRTKYWSLHSEGLFTRQKTIRSVIKNDHPPDFLLSSHQLRPSSSQTVAGSSTFPSHISHCWGEIAPNGGGWNTPASHSEGRLVKNDVSLENIATYACLARKHRKGLSSILAINP